MNQFQISENVAKIFLTKLSEREEEMRMIDLTTDEADTIFYQTFTKPDPTSHIRAEIEEFIEEFLRQEGETEDKIQAIISSLEEAKSLQEMRDIIEPLIPLPDEVTIPSERYKISKERKSKVRKGLIEFLVDAGLATESINSILRGLENDRTLSSREIRLLLTKQGVSGEVISWILGNL